MPIYEYHCKKCLKDHEIIQKLSDTPLPICPACGGSLEKKLSLGGFQLKGGGWYKDGYAKPKPSESKPANAPKEASKKDSNQTPSTKTPSTNEK